MKIEIYLDALAEERTPEAAEKKERYAPGFADAVRGQIKKAKAIKPGSKWGWCTVKLTAMATPQDGVQAFEDAYLGECSYESADDFAKNSGYYPSMVREAVEKVLKRICPGY